MRWTERKTARRRLWRPFSAAALTAGTLLLVPAAKAQMNPQQDVQLRSVQSSQTPSSTPISDAKLSAAATAIDEVSTIRQSYESKIVGAPPSDKQRLTDDAIIKAVTDQGLSVDEFNSIISTAQSDPTVRERLIQRIPHSGH